MFPGGQEVEVQLCASLWESQGGQGSFLATGTGGEGADCSQGNPSFFLGLPPSLSSQLSSVHPSDPEVGKLGLWGP